MQSIFLQTEHLSYSYRKETLVWVLSEIDFETDSEAFLLICGPSGSGKSTLCRTFNGLIPHFYNGELKGDVRVAGKSVRRQSVGDLFRRVGMVFQNPETQLFNGTVEQEIAFGGGKSFDGSVRPPSKSTYRTCSREIRITFQGGNSSSFPSPPFWRLNRD